VHRQLAVPQRRRCSTTEPRIIRGLPCARSVINVILPLVTGTRNARSFMMPKMAYRRGK